MVHKSRTMTSAALFGSYGGVGLRRLRERFRSDDWQEVLQDEGFLRECRSNLIPPSSPPSQLRGVARYLIERNGCRVAQLVSDGERDRERLVGVLGDWEAALADDRRHPLLFLGLTLTTRCSFRPRCIYCNQRQCAEQLTVERLKELIEEAATPTPPYVYLTGGEPLLLGEAVYGTAGLLSHAARLHCATNVNTNAALIRPRTALFLIRSGLTRIHISLDAADVRIQGRMFGSRKRVREVWRGVLDLLIARELMGAEHPRIHINCVVTKLNLDDIPSLLRAIWSLRPEGAAGTLDDFAFHLIPVGGESNAPIRPSAGEWYRLYTTVWEQADAEWQRQQAREGIPAADRNALHEALPFANPFLRVDHRMSLEEYCAQAEAGVYWQGALCERCYVAPTQACVLPDGSQHWCGGHAIRRPPPMGDATRNGLRQNIRASLTALRELPGPDCLGCAGATCVINQATRAALYAHVDELLTNRESRSR